MKALSINNVLPLMALLAVGCSSPLALQTSEHDDVYFSSSDQVTLPGEPAVASAPGERYNTETYAYDPETGEPVNPDYVEGGTTGNAYATDEYRDESYGDVFVSQNVRPRYQMPFNQYGSMAFVDPFFNPYYPMAYRSFVNPYWGPGMMYDPFYAYDPFFMPSARFGFGFGLGFGMGYGMGMGGFGMNPFMDPFGMSYGMMSPYGMSPWGYNRMMMNNYHMGYNHGLYRQYYANNDAFEPQRTVYAPRNARNVSPVTRGERAMTGRPEATGRTRAEGRSGNYSPDAVGSQSAGRPARTVDSRGGDTRTERVGERPALQNRPQRPQDQQQATRYRTQSEGTATQQAPATRQQTRRAERVEYSRPVRTQEAPVRTTTPSYDRGTSSPSYSQPSYSRPAMSSPSGGGSAPSGGGRPSRR